MAALARVPSVTSRHARIITRMMPLLASRRSRSWTRGFAASRHAERMVDAWLVSVRNASFIIWSVSSRAALSSCSESPPGRAHSGAGTSHATSRRYASQYFPVLLGLCVVCVRVAFYVGPRLVHQCAEGAGGAARSDDLSFYVADGISDGVCVECSAFAAENVSYSRQCVGDGGCVGWGAVKRAVAL